MTTLPPGYSDGEYADPTQPVSEQVEDPGWLPRTLDAAETEIATWPEWKRDAMRREVRVVGIPVTETPLADDEMVEF